MMKCNICGGRTLPRAKLCLPCRAALRRARDDTVSELLPLPRRLEAMAFAGARTVSQTLDIVGVRRTRRRSKANNSVVPAPAPSGSSPMQTTAIAHLGGATLDNEENYLVKKLFTAGLGMVCVSNQARI